MLRSAGLLLPGDQRVRHVDEWIDHFESARECGEDPQSVARSIVVRSVIPLVLRAWTRRLGATLARRNGRRVAERLVRAAGLLVPVSERADQCAEWLDHVRSAGEKGIRPIACALSIALVAAPLIAVLARYDARRRQATR